MIRPFSQLNYPGHALVGSLMVIGLAMSLIVGFFDQDYLSAFAIGPIIMLNMGFRSAGLRFSTDPLGTSIFHTGCVILFFSVMFVRYYQLS